LLILLSTEKEEKNGKEYTLEYNDLMNFWGFGMGSAEILLLLLPSKREKKTLQRSNKFS
jgi:hypothetical protein